MKILGDVAKWLVYQFTWLILMIVFTAYVRLRVSGLASFPRRKAVLVLSNHQSFLDPPMIGVSIPRRLRYAARDTLFRWRLLGSLMSALGAIPLNREGVAAAGLKEVLRSLGQSDAMVFFPEGTRTPDGHIASFKRGIGLILRRSEASVVLCGIAGAFEAWPRRWILPGPGVVWIHYKKWERPAGRGEMNEEVLLPALESALQEVFDEANRRRSRYLARRNR